MPAVQSSYSERMAEAVAGLVASERAWDGITRNCETAAGIGFGLAVGRGADDGGCKLAGTLPEFLGVSIRDVTLDVNLNAGVADEYAENQNVGVLTQGEIWVQVSGTPGPGDPVHFNATTGVFAASGGTGPIRGARWMKTAANGLGKLYLSGDAQAAA